MNIFGRIQRFAGDRINQIGGAIKNLIPSSAQPITPTIPNDGQYRGPGGKPDGSGIGQARSTGMDPRRTALRETVSWAEGTGNADGTPNYSMRYGDKKGSAGSLDVTKPHPKNVISSPWGGSSGSNASGAYQFLDNTWAEMNDGRNAVMSPANQDAAFDRLVDERIGYDIAAPFEDQVTKFSGSYASFPDDSGQSKYDQPVKSVQELSDVYDNRLDVNLELEQDKLRQMGLR